jgi:hypothetical protein
MKILNKHKFLSLFLVLLISISSLGLVFIGKYTNNTSESFNNPPLSFILMKLVQPTYFKIQEQIEGQTPEIKLSQIINSIIYKDQKSFESLYPTENLGWVSLYENDRFSTGNLDEVKENRDKQRNEARDKLWKENISSYKILSVKYFNQPCCATGWNETDNKEFIAMVRYEVELTRKDSKKLQYNFEITVSNPMWIESNEQLEARNWIITNISDKDLPELHKGF